MKVAGSAESADGRDVAAGGPTNLRDFAGRWGLRRRIADIRAGTEARMEGEAVLRPDVQVLVYDEAGLLHFGTAPPLRASRRYLWRDGGPGRIEVRFEDGRAFHVFALGAAASAEHDCAPDRYEVRYDFAAWPLWRAEWRVRGPRKDYLSVTDYAPLAG